MAVDPENRLWGIIGGAVLGVLVSIPVHAFLGFNVVSVFACGTAAGALLGAVFPRLTRWVVDLLGWAIDLLSLILR